MTVSIETKIMKSKYLHVTFCVMLVFMTAVLTLYTNTPHLTQHTLQSCRQYGKKTQLAGQSHDINCTCIMFSIHQKYLFTCFVLVSDLLLTFLINQYKEFIQLYITKGVLFFSPTISLCRLLKCGHETQHLQPGSSTMELLTLHCTVYVFPVHKISIVYANFLR